MTMKPTHATYKRSRLLTFVISVNIAIIILFLYHFILTLILQNDNPDTLSNNVWGPGNTPPQTTPQNPIDLTEYADKVRRKFYEQPN